MRNVLALVFACSMSAVILSQSPPQPAEREAILKTVQAFFDTMAAKDVEGARKILILEGRFNALRMQDGKWSIRTFSTDEYLKTLGNGKQAMRERMWNPEVRIHGAIATVWTPYDFWIDGKFSHCGIDAFDLVKTDEGWKLTGGNYTIEPKCDPSPLGNPGF